MIVIDPASPIPAFQQLRTQLVEAIADGDLDAGSRLPTVRRLADDLGLAPGTVARAYRELEAAGVIETRGRNGSFVATNPDDPSGQVRYAAWQFAEQVRALSIDAEDAIAYVVAALRSAPSTL